MQDQLTKLIRLLLLVVTLCSVTAISGCIVPEEVITDIVEDFKKPHCEPKPASTILEGDLNGDGQVNVVDVQCSINVKLWMESNSDDPLPACAANLPISDLNCDFVIDDQDVYLAVFIVLGKPLPEEVDSNQDGVADACQCL